MIVGNLSRISIMYLTLPCSASQVEFASNRIGHYNTLLSRQIELDGINEVGLCEILLPVPKIDISKSVGTISYFRSNKAGTPTYKFNFYEDVTCFADFDKVNYPSADELGNQVFCFAFQEESLSLSILDGWSIKIDNEKLANVLGFNHDKVYRGLHAEQTSYKAAMNKSVELAYVYCDICEHSVVGDEMAPILRSVPLVPHRPTIIRFENIHYVTLTSNRLRTIEVEICSDLGEEIRFTEGVSYVKLHIRHKK